MTPSDHAATTTSDDEDDDYDDGQGRDCMTCGGDCYVHRDDLGDPDAWQLPNKMYLCPNCGGSGDAKDQTYW